MFGTMKGTDKDAGYPKCLWSYSMRDSVLALSTQIEGGRVSIIFFVWYVCDYFVCR